MKCSNMIKIVKRGFHESAFYLKKHSPEILMILGISAGAGTVVAACVSTYKITPEIKEAKRSIGVLKDKLDDITGDDSVSYKAIEEEITATNKEIREVKKETAITIVSAYVLPTALGIMSVTSLLASHKIIKNRNVALAAAYTALDKGFTDYRARVVERFGENVDKELRHGVSEVRKEVLEDGTVKEVPVVNSDPNLPSDYACYFDERSRSYNPIPDYNLLFVKAQQNYANNKFISQGHLFLNEVYDMLDLPRTKMGAVTGWLYRPNDSNRDNLIDFRILETEKRNENGDLVPVLALDFNVDGVIINDIE